MSSNTIFGFIIVVLSIGHQLLSVQIKLSVSPQDGAEKNRDDEQILKNSSIFHVDGEQKLIIWKTLNEKVQVSKQASWVRHMGTLFGLFSDAYRKNNYYNGLEILLI